VVRLGEPTNKKQINAQVRWGAQVIDNTQEQQEPLGQWRNNFASAQFRWSGMTLRFAHVRLLRTRTYFQQLSQGAFASDDKG
jgi:hypothetical protein